MSPWIAVALGLGLAVAAPSEADLLAAIRKGDAAAVKALLDQGVSANAKYRYDRSALSFAADRGQVEVVRLLLDRGADPNAKDTFYKMTALSAAAEQDHVEVVRLLIARGATDIGGIVLRAVREKSLPLLEIVIGSGRLTPHDLSYALEEALKAEAPELADRLRQAGAVAPPKAEFQVPAETLARYVGTYRDTKGTDEVTFSVAEGALQAAFGGRTLKLAAYDAVRFKIVEAPGAVIEFQVQDGRATGHTVYEIGEISTFARVTEGKP
jgi:hypothetical protein